MGQDSPWSTAVDSTHVYWPNFSVGATGSVMKVPINGGPPIALATGQNGPRRISVDSTSVYWPDYDGGTVVKVPK
jgi:hypothetical protein